MKKLIFSAVICVFLSVNLFAQQTSILRQLLDLPAPPPYSVPDDVGENDDDSPKRSEEFYAAENVPPDDAPIEDVFDYWKQKSSVYYLGSNNVPQISTKNAERLLEKSAKEPKNLTDFFKVFPKDSATVAKIKEIFDVSQYAEGIDDEWRKTVKSWLKFNSTLYVDELAAEVSKAKDQVNYGSVFKEDELIALTKLNWETAEPILRTLETDTANIRTSTLAKTLLYKHAIATEDDAEIEKYRNELKKTVSDSNLPASSRDTASDALFETEWQGQDEYYLSLMEDETLLFPKEKYQLFTPLTTIVSKNPDKWIPILAKLVGNKNRAVHNAAVQNLVKYRRRDALEPLLPWLSDPNWADIKLSPGGRITYMQIVANVDLPESVPGLIWIVENEDENINWAAGSLAKYKDSRAIPALKNALNRIGSETYRNDIISALIACGGLTVDEQLSALEFYAEYILKPENVQNIYNRSSYGNENPLPVKVSIGKFISEGRLNPSEDLILRTIEREKILQREKPEVAKSLSEIMQKWQGRLVDLEILRKISNGSADAETITSALERRVELKERVENDLYAMRGKSGLAGALAACLLMEDNDILSAFRSQDIEKQIGTLACARLIRAELPVNEVGVYLNSENKLFALAAERYLESEDSPEARSLVWAKHPGEALILGARETFDPANVSASYADRFNEIENEIRKEVLEDDNLQQIFSFGAHRIRIYADKIVYHWNLDDARYRERVLKKEEFDAFHRAVIEKDIYNRPPVRGYCHHNCASDEFIILNRNGGRRLYMFTGSYKLKPYYELFENLQTKDAKLYYRLSDKIKGLNVLLADEKYSPQAIWKNGDDFRVLIEDNVRKNQIEEDIERLNSADSKNEELDYTEKEKLRFERKTQRQYESFEWRKIENGELGAAVSEPAELPFLRDKLSFPAIKDLNSNESIWQAKTGNYEVRAGEYSKGGLWKVNRGEQFQIKDGLYAFPIVSGNWVVAAKTVGSWASPNNVVRVNLRTGKEYKVNVPPADNFNPIAFVPSHNKVLLYRAKDDYGYSKKVNNPSPETPEYYLLDAQTGKTELVKGEFRPLIQQTFRPLQPTGKPNEFWAAIYDRAKNQTLIGRYDAKNFAMKTVLILPEIELDSMSIWVDQREAKVYFIYKGSYFGESHLLSLPLSKELEQASRE